MRATVIFIFMEVKFMDNNINDSVFYETGLDFFDNAIGNDSIKGIKESSIIYFIGEDTNKDLLTKYSIYLGYNLICNVKHKYRCANTRNGLPNIISCINLTWPSNKDIDGTLYDYCIGINTIDHDTECPLNCIYFHTIDDLYNKIRSRYCIDCYLRHSYEDITVRGDIVKRVEPSVLIISLRDIINTDNNTLYKTTTSFKKLCDLCRKYNIILFLTNWVNSFEYTQVHCHISPINLDFKPLIYEFDYIIRFKSRKDSIFLDFIKNTVGNTGEVEGIIL